MASARPECLRWLKANKWDLAPLTGTDTDALITIAAAWKLFAYTGSRGVLKAIRYLVAEMQPKNRHLARELIAYALDWNDRARLWPAVDPDARPHVDDDGDDDDDDAEGERCPHGVAIDEGSTADMSCAQCHVEAQGA